MRHVLYWLRRRTALWRLEDGAAQSLARVRAQAEDVDGRFRHRRTVDEFYFWADVRRIVNESAWWIVVSAAPGLAQLIQRRFRSIRVIWLCWLLGLALTLFFLSLRGIALLLFGLTVVLHAWIAADGALLFTQLKRVFARLVGLGVAIAWVCLVYWGVRVTVFRSVIGGEAVFDMPHHDVARHDYLLGRRGTGVLRRGDLVILRVPNGNAVSEIIGLPNELIEVSLGRFRINGEVLDPMRYQVPDWLRRRQVSVRLRSDEYLVRMGYRVQVANNRRLVERAVRGSLVAGRRMILGRPFMRWMPLRRRGFLEDAEGNEDAR